MYLLKNSAIYALLQGGGAAFVVYTIELIVFRCMKPDVSAGYIVIPIAILCVLICFTEVRHFSLIPSIVFGSVIPFGFYERIKCVFRHQEVGDLHNSNAGIILVFIVLSALSALLVALLVFIAQCLFPQRNEKVDRELPSESS